MLEFFSWSIILILLLQYVLYALVLLVDLHVYLMLQIVNVYNQQYESAAAFWPHVHSRIIASLLISQLLLLGLLSTKKAANSTPLLVILPILTLSFHKYCKIRFEPAFRKYPLEVSFVFLQVSKISLHYEITFSTLNLNRGTRYVCLQVLIPLFSSWYYFRKPWRKI
jgi:hypothetical protein